ncbi:hypothetical protein [Maledivibacter halophilus]|uniref:Uncharacterized protein n=1 Tax=Maledivibacter halophilus TaxID=36842 RepID=A0A1T5KYA2_9FIRM|nr:hypothetical protein [Maledivibacter halophilus]SKC68737.1 hypothetical protein SAMN02194393_02180 [Maledivibacter halophilus]
MVLRVLKYINKYRNIIIIYFLILAYFLTWVPKEFNHSFDGVKYRLNSDKIIKETRVVFEGVLIKPIFGGNSFSGTITIDGVKYNVFELKFDEFNSASINGLKDSGASFSLGYIYFDKAYESFTITLYEKKGLNSYGWNPENGLMVTAPAQNRAEAVELANYHLQKKMIKRGTARFN